MTFGVKTNERPGTRAQVRYARLSAWKARQVLDLIRGQEIAEADEILQFVERDAAIIIRKCLQSAVANAAHNDELDPDELYVSACYADEGPTLKRWRPRARGRATRIRKRTCHITVIVSRLSEEQLDRRRRRDEAAGPGARRGRRGAEARRARVAKSRAAAAAAPEEEELPEDEELEAEDLDIDEEFESDDEDEALEPLTDEAEEGEAAEPPGGAANEAGHIGEAGAGEAEGATARDEKAEAPAAREENAEGRVAQEDTE